MEFGSFDVGVDDEYNGFGFVVISEICAVQDSFFSGTETFESVHRVCKFSSSFDRACDGECIGISVFATCGIVGTVLAFLRVTE